MCLKEKLFPAKNPATIRMYGRFEYELQGRVIKQIKEAFQQEISPDGFIFLIDSKGGETKVLHSFINYLDRFGLPLMGLVENDAFSSAAEFLLECQYRVAKPFAKILFHHLSFTIQGHKMLDPAVLAQIIANNTAEEKAHMDRFSRITGQTNETTHALYNADNSMLAPRALELGIIHEITEEKFILPKELLKEM